MTLNKKYLGRAVAAGAVLVFLWGCGEKAPAPQAPPTTLPVSSDLPAQTPPISGSAPVVVPDSIRGKWGAVRLVVEDKEGGGRREYTVKLGSELVLPDSNLVLKVSHFLPDLKIQGNTFTSASNELLNPAAHLAVSQDGTEIFNGWLFQLFPNVHPFNHDRYRVTLKDGLPSS